MHKGEEEIQFNIKIPTIKSHLWAGCFIRRQASTVNETALATLEEELKQENNNEDKTGKETEEKITKVNINQAHCLLGHSNENATRESAKRLGWIITKGPLNICKHCAIGKAKQRNTKKKTTPVIALRPGERISLDVMSVKRPLTKPGKTPVPFIVNKNVRVMVDQYSSLGFSDWYEKKDHMIETTCEQLFQLREEVKGVKYVR